MQSSTKLLKCERMYSENCWPRIATANYVCNSRVPECKSVLFDIIMLGLIPRMGCSTTSSQLASWLFSDLFWILCRLPWEHQHIPPLVRVWEQVWSHGDRFAEAPNYTLLWEHLEQQFEFCRSIPHDPNNNKVHN